ncbi:MAG TPA: hypothetical protein VGN23_13120 [Verrucomicrobiae bacterium]|jgi:hypothetical protein
MGDADKELKISIVTDADLSGYKATEAAQNDVTAGAAKLGDQTKDENKKAADSVEDLSHGYRAQFLLLTELNRIVPGLGEVLHGAFAGPLAPLLVLTAGIQFLYGQIKSYQAALDDAAEAAANDDFLPNIEDKLKVLRDATDTARKFADSISNAATNEQGLIDKLNIQLGVDQAIERAQAALTSAQKELDIAKVQEAESKGNITPEQAAEQRAQIEKHYIQKAADDRATAQQKDFADQENNIKVLQSRQAALDAASQAAQDKLTKEQVHRAEVAIPDEKKFKEDIDKAGSDVDTAQDAYDKAYADIHYKLTGTTSGPLTPGDQASVDYATKDQRDALDKAKAHQQQLAQEWKQYWDDKQKGEFQGDKDDVDNTKRAANENRQAIQKAQDELAKAKANATAEAPIQAQTTQTQFQTVDTQERARIAKQAEEDARVIREYDHSKNPSTQLLNQAAKAIQDLQGTMATHGDLLKSIADLAPVLANLAADQAKTKALLDRATRQIGAAATTQ